MKITAFITFAAILFCGYINANATDYILYEDWSNCIEGSLPDGWTTIGTDKTPSGYAASFFEYGDGMKAMELPGSSNPYVVSYSTTLEGGKVDTRLISPQFTIPSAGAILSFNAVNYNPEASIANKIEVFAVNEITNNEESIFIVRVPSNNVVDPVTYNLSLGDYAGQEINFIIANEGTDAGLLGIGTICVSEYIGEIKDSTPLFTSVEDNRKLELEVGLLAPCKGFTAMLTTSTGIEETYEYSGNINEVYKIYNLPFKSSFTLKKGEVMEYTVSVTPNIEGATPLVLTGSTGCGDGFPMVCVEEEGTGEKCGYCPAGAAGIEKFSDEYGDRFIGIGIHCSSFSTGVMESPTYAEPFVNNTHFPIVSLPSAILNRKIAQSPTYFDDMDIAVSKITEETSVAETQINSVVYTEETHAVKVRFSTRLALPLTSTDLKAAVVLLADSLTGSNIKWWQHNYYSGTSKQDFLKQANESWWEYMKFYCEYPAEIISPTDMTFNHVAIGIYPDFFGNGCSLRSDWTEGTVDEREISFVMPMQGMTNGFGVQNPANTSVVALIFNGRTGEIIAADKAHASTYELSAVESITEVAIPLRSYFIDMNGMRHSVAPKSISIKVTEYSDGSFRTVKILTH